MGREQATPSSSGLYGRGGERGAGGKLRKPSARRLPPTPYDRPPANQSQAADQSRDGGWLSKLVDPACRLISGGATRIFPSFFSKSLSSAASTTEDLDNCSAEVEEHADDDNEGLPSNHGVSESAEGTNSRKVADTLSARSDVDQLGRDMKTSLADGTEFSKIEQLVKDRRFSRDDFNRLIELLNSKVAEVSNVEPVVQKPKMPIQREEEGAVLAHETPQLLFKETQECLNIAGSGTSVPLFQSAVEEEVGASPIDIARAYMGSRVSEVTTDTKGTVSRYRGGIVRSDKYASQPLIASPSSKSSVCWPGAMVEDRFRYSTPPSVSSRYGLHQFQRTPYSRTIYSKSKSKLVHPEADANRFQNILPSTRLQPQTPIYGQSKDDGVLNNISGSVGPIRHLQPNFLSEASPRQSISHHSSLNGYSPSASTKSFLPATKNFNAGASNTTAEFQSVGPTVNSSEAVLPTFQTSNPVARAILEHLDRNKPTPKEKSAELQLATSWKKASSSKEIDTMLKDGTQLGHFGGFDLRMKGSFFDKQSSAQGSDRGNLNVGKRLEERSEAIDVNNDTETYSTVNGNHGFQTNSTHEASSSGFSNVRERGTTEGWPSHKQNEEQTLKTMPLNSSLSESLKKHPFHPSGSKPQLASISVENPYLRQTIFSDNSSAFTFPVSKSSGTLSEPPTPSIMPFTIASGLPQPKKNVSEIPSYTFGTKRSTPPLEFSFPSTSTASIQDEVSDLKFSFGSDKKNRISFGSVGKDAICY